MILVLSPETVQNRAALQLRRVPERRLERGFRVMPRGGASTAVFWRILFDQGLTRYVVTLAPFPLAMVIRPDLALAISQAPLLMFAVVYAIESLVLTVPTPTKRRALIDPDEAARWLDVFRLRCREILGRIAAGRRMQDAVLHLVVEQSCLRRVPILTLISVQVEATEPGEKPQMLALDAGERAMIVERLFAEGLAEDELHLVNLADNVFLRDVSLEARTISAHARLMALARAQPAAEAATEA